jgi:uncharacterized coiled-coil protein SlyX
MPTDERLSTRLMDLELMFTHLERQVGDLSQVVLRQQQRIELLEKQIRLLQRGDDDEAEELPDPEI